MSKAARTAITPIREDNFAEWYQQVIKAADLAENSPVRGCMTIKPYGFALWENMQRIFDDWLKEYGIQNTAFPLLIPLEYISREAKHVEGFATECAVVTHHRLEKNEDGTALVPAGKLEEPYVIRPTSETIIGEAMSRWIQSYRDLPMKLNQWGSVMRWEMRTRMFLRTSEFFWHEGHNAFASKEEAVADTTYILDLYEKFFHEYLAFPGIKGLKPECERFPGADDTYCIEAMMQDGKALQAATSHYLGQNFSKTFNIKFQTKEGGEDFVHTTSWAFSSRMVGGLIMVHGDDDGMIMPPRIAPQQIVVLPIVRDDADEDRIFAYADKIVAALKAKGLKAHTDKREMRTPDKMWDAVKKGIPLRVEVGGREVDDEQVTHVRRDIGRESKTTQGLDDFVAEVEGILDAIHDNLFDRATKRMNDRITDIADLPALDAFFDGDYDGFAKMDAAMLDATGMDAIMDKHKLTPRCLPLADEGKTIIIGKAY